LLLYLGFISKSNLAGLLRNPHGRP